MVKLVHIKVTEAMFKLIKKFNPVGVIHGYENGFWCDDLVLKKEVLKDNKLFYLSMLPSSLFYSDIKFENKR